ncbi:MAG: hypothetical protein E7370_03690 [Clostridiales bacterium]|nr:hypothetical protein [Clostridiales bacterium]
MDKKSTAKNGKIRSIIVIVCIAISLLSLFIANSFFPLKYTFAYFVSAKNKPVQGEAFVQFIDVGYGDCTIVHLPDGKSLLIDCGDGAYTNNYKILSALNSCGINKIDYAICTSIHQEHSGGFADIINLKGVGSLFCPYAEEADISASYYNMRLAANKVGAEIIYNKYGVGAYGKDYFFVILSPTDWNSPLSEYVEMQKNPTKSNVRNASAVIWLSVYGTNFLFSGDGSYKIAKKICTDYGAISPYCPVGDNSVLLDECDVLIAGDHGHADSMFVPLYSLLTPNYVVVSVGDNARDCPDTETLAQIKGIGATALITQQIGNITFKITANGYSVN